MDDIDMNPKPVPTGGDTPPGSGSIDEPPTPEAGIIDSPPAMPEPETNI